MLQTDPFDKIDITENLNAGQYQTNISMRGLKQKFDETNHLSSLVTSLKLGPEHRILDIGCGYGKNLKLLLEKGLNVIGIDINPAIVETNRAHGLNCITPEEFNKTSDYYDLMIMSHLIEHFLPLDLIDFIDHYLTRLKVGGHLIITSPLMWPCFFSNFDHLKPYPPEAVDSMFVLDDAQTAFCSKYKLQPIDIRIRRRRIWLSPGQELYLKQEWPSIQKWQRKILGGLFKLTRGLIGCTDGWIGLYQNIGPRNQNLKLNQLR